MVIVIKEKITRLKILNKYSPWCYMEVSQEDANEGLGGPNLIYIWSMDLEDTQVGLVSETKSYSRDR